MKTASFPAILLLIGPSLAAADNALDPRDSTACFAAADRNHDQRVTREEFTAIGPRLIAGIPWIFRSRIKSDSGSLAQAVEQAFGKPDGDHSGELDVTEFPKAMQAFARALGLNPPEK
jgi:Ca2+-binding EF-hand superfamily protein